MVACVYVSFTLIDILHFVQAYADYYTMMDLSEELIRACADAINGKQIIEYQGESLDLEKPFRRATMHDLVKEATGKAPASPFWPWNRI